jgi:signal transduction histidine kinase
MDLRTRAYVGIVLAAGLAVLAVLSAELPRWDFAEIATWSVLSILAEMLWLSTISGQATVSMASTFNLAVLLLLGMEKAAWVVGASTLFANFAIQKREWYKALFNLAQMTLTVSFAGLLYRLLGGGLLTVGNYHRVFDDPHQILTFSAAAISYHAANTCLVAGVIALTTRRPVVEVWLRNYGYANEIVSSMALLLLAPIVVLSYLAVGMNGIVLFFIPLFFIRDSCKRYIDLERAQDSLIRSERMAAKGEMAAEIGHELNNYLAAISGRAQLLLMAAQKLADPKILQSAQIIYENAKNMAGLTKGLMDFSHKDTQKRKAEINDLIRKTVEFIWPQNKFDGIAFQLDECEPLPEISVDAGQIQQVLLNLFSNAADALNEGKRSPKVIRVKTGFLPDRGLALIEISDNGPGINPEISDKIFEPGATDKKGGHGFGLSTSFRIIENHKGRIEVKSRAGEGATFSIYLPAA